MTSLEVRKKSAFRTDRSGQGLIEYLALVLLVCVISLVSIRSLGKKVQDKIQKARDEVEKL